MNLFFIFVMPGWLTFADVSGFWLFALLRHFVPRNDSISYEKVM